MTYRDDEEAARARVAALEIENARLRKQVADKEAKQAEDRAKAEARAMRKAAAEAPKRNRYLLYIAVFVAGSIFMMFTVLGPYFEERRRSAEIGANQAVRTRWQALVFVEPCVRAAEDNVRHAAALRAEPENQSHDAGPILAQLGSHCVSIAYRLIADPDLPIEARDALARWGHAARRIPVQAAPLAAYYHHRDWTEDRFAAVPALWHELAPELDAWRGALEGMRRATLPAIRAVIGALAAEHEARGGRDATWWRIQVGLTLWDLRAAGQQVLEPEESGGRVDPATLAAALRGPAERVIELARDAPASVRDDLKWSYPGLTALAEATAADPRGALHTAMSKDLLWAMETP